MLKNRAKVVGSVGLWVSVVDPDRKSRTLRGVGFVSIESKAKVVDWWCG